MPSCSCSPCKRHFAKKAAADQPEPPSASPPPLPAPRQAEAEATAGPAEAAEAPQVVAGVQSLNRVIVCVLPPDDNYFRVYISRAHTCEQVRQLIGVDPSNPNTPAGDSETSFYYALCPDAVYQLRGNAHILGYFFPDRSTLEDANNGSTFMMVHE